MFTRVVVLSQYADTGRSPHDLVAQTERIAPSLTTLCIPYSLYHFSTICIGPEGSRLHTGWKGWLKKGKYKDTNLDRRESLQELHSEV